MRTIVSSEVFVHSFSIVLKDYGEGPHREWSSCISCIQYYRTTNDKLSVGYRAEILYLSL